MTSLDTATPTSRAGRAMPDRPLLVIIAMAIGGFAIGVTEFASMGLLPQIAAGVGISIPSAGHLISAYALGVVVGAPLLAGLAARVPRRHLLLTLMTVFALGNVATALSHSYGALLLARFVSGLPHGAYFGVAAVVAASLVRPDRRARAVATLMVGLTVANIAGVPAATWLGQRFGWPAAYVAVSLIAVSCLVAMAAVVPDRREGDGGRSIRAELGALRRPQVWFALVTGMIGFGGMFATYSYIAPTVRELAGLSELDVVWLLGVYGVGMTIGMVLGGRLADRALVRTLVLGLLAQAVVLAVFSLLATTWLGAFVAVFLLGLASMVLMPALQTRLMDVASDGQSLAAALNHSTLNIANAAGAWLGGAVLAAGFSYAWPSRFSAVLPLAGIAVFLVGLVVERRSRRLRGSALDR